MSRIKFLFIISFLLLSACSAQPAQPLPNKPAGQYQYQVGLGYGFLGKHISVSVDGVEVLSIVGTEEIEDFAQLLGTKILGGGSTDNQRVTVQVVVDGVPPLSKLSTWLMAALSMSICKTQN